MAIPWMALSLGAQALPGIVGMFRKKPKAPDIPEFRELLTPEEEQEMFALWEKSIGTDVNRAVGASKASLAGRGMFRSGTTGRVEADIRKAGVDFKAQKTFDWTLAKARRRSDWRMKRFGVQESRYGQQLSDYYGGQATAGAGLGQSASNLMMWMNMNQKKPQG